VKLVRATIAAALALGAAFAIQLATQSGASASVHPPLHTDCGNCWGAAEE
jgi:hypothetical protein